MYNGICLLSKSEREVKTVFVKEFEVITIEETDNLLSENERRTFFETLLRRIKELKAQKE